MSNPEELYIIFVSEGDTIVMKMMSSEGNPWNFPADYHLKFWRGFCPTEEEWSAPLTVMGYTVLIHIHFPLCLPSKSQRSRRKKSQLSTVFADFKSLTASPAQEC